MVLHILLFIVLFNSLCVHTQTIYTVEQIHKCFTQRALPQCSVPLEQCMKNPQCEQQLLKYQNCAFGSQLQQIFNGYCFKKWKLKAQLTSQIFDCINKQCNLLYNSQIGIKELFHCSQKTIIENLQSMQQQCQDQCLKQLNQVQKQFYQKPLRELFSQKMENPAANFLLQKIKENCIDQPYQPQDLIQTSEKTQQSSDL